MRTDELDYELPAELVAVRPAEPRDTARLLVVRTGGLPGSLGLHAGGPGHRLDERLEDRLEHRRVRDLPALLAPGDRLVMNTTRVLPARFVGRWADTGGRVEGLWLSDADHLGRQGERATAADQSRAPVPGAWGSPGGSRSGRGLVWIAMLRARRFRPGRRIEVGRGGEASGVELEPIGRAGDRPGLEGRATTNATADPDHEAGAWLVRVHTPWGVASSTPAVLERIGLPPLPPYIRSARRRLGLADTEAADTEAYQTVMAGETTAADRDPNAEPDLGTDAPPIGSVAAPTAGLHFTPRLLDELGAAGVERAGVTLHVGAGTFKPVEVDELEAHPMHAEWCSLEPSGPRLLEQPRRPDGQPGRTIAVGTTSVRTLESFAAMAEAAVSGGGEASGAPPPSEAVAGWLPTRLLIAPGYRWRAVDGLMTNFHLPRSTLMALVAAMLPGGVEELKAIYRVAIGRGYRFYSYGDAMLVLP